MALIRVIRLFVAVVGRAGAWTRANGPDIVLSYRFGLPRLDSSTQSRQLKFEVRVQSMHHRS
jgi:hypothetical protein